MLLFSDNRASAQGDSTKHQAYADIQKKLMLVTGYNYYGHSGAELGLGTVSTSYAQVDAFWASTYVASEVFYNKGLFIGPKISAWFSNGLLLGACFVYYTNFSTSSLEFRPEIGAGMDYFRFYYGRNMPTTNTAFNYLCKNMIGVNVSFDVKKLHTIRRQHSHTTRP